MADVFLSYKHEDVGLAERVSEELRREGLSVWWDERVTPIASWDATIESEINEAATVVVLWTPRSVGSEWVRTEAHYAQERGKLVPVILEDCQLPIAFLLRQAIRLSGWDGDSNAREWRKLLTWIGDLRSTKLGKAGLVQGPSAAASNPFRNSIGQLPSGDPIVDGAFVNAATPAGTAFRDGDALPVLRIVASGAFLLGSPISDPDRTAVEGPQRRIAIPMPFAIGVFPVLTGEYRHVMGQLPSTDRISLSSGGSWSLFKRKVAPAPPPAVFVDNAPVTHVSFDDAQALIENLMRSTGERYRLPSEAEWEYACRAGSQTRYAFGDTLATTMATFAARSGPSLVGAHQPNAFGLYDMHGNVREWTADLWHESYDSTPADGGPAVAGHGSMRVVRGGGWCDDAVSLRSAARMRATQTTRSPFIGLRVARALG